MKKKVLVINHVFWPDMHNTARHISELSEELVIRNWDVTALICNRSYSDFKNVISPLKGIWKGVKYKRVYIPPLNQKSNIQRLITAFWLVISWILHLPFIGKFDAVIIGTNPPFSYLMVPFIRLLKGKSKIFMWGFDLYPEAIIVSGGNSWRLLGNIFKPIAKFCYAKLDVLVDIGPCMRNLYQSYNHKAKEITLPPWSFVEPSSLEEPHSETRLELFGDAKLTIIYSGTIGNAHEFENFLSLARELRKRQASVAFCFAGFGNKFEDLKSMITDVDTNITIGGFVKTDQELKNRLSSADIQMISLRKNWTGISVPSKYFGAIASGKAVLFSGSENSAISIWTKQFDLGFLLHDKNVSEIADLLISISRDNSKLIKMQTNAFKIYKEKFSKKVICDGWSQILNETIQNN